MNEPNRFFRSNTTVLLALSSILIAVLLLSGCSAVFDAGLSGTITDADSGAGIAGVMVYAYTDEDLRDSDYAGKGAVTGPDGVKLYFTPSTAGNYIPTTSTADDGSFTINKLIWKTLYPAFGKTADYLDVYLLYFHSDYGLVKEESEVTIVSDSNNSSRVKAELAPRLKSKRITINIKDIATDELATTGFEVKVKATIAGKSEPYYYPRDDENLNNVIGSTAITVPYLANKDDGESTVNITVSIPQDSTWQWVDVSTKPDYYMASDDYSITVTDDELRGEAAISKTAYVKGYEFDYPDFSGTVATEGLSPSGIASASNDNVHVWLAEVDSKDASGAITLKVIDSVITGPDGNGANTSTIYHGLFTGLGAGKQWEPALEASGEHQGDYSGDVAKTVAYLIIDDSAAGTVGTPDIADYFYLVKIKCTDDAQKPLGVLSEPKNSAFKVSGSGDYFITAVENDI